MASLLVAAVAPVAAHGTGATAQESAIATWMPCTGGVGTTPGPAPAATPALDEAVMASFGPLAAEPRLTITVPMTSADEPAVTTPPGVSVQRVDGGLLVEVRHLTGPGFGLAVVGHDGSVRWTACSDRQLWRVDAGPGAGSAVVTTGAGDPTAGEPDRVERWSLADGEVVGELTDEIVEISGGLRYAASTPGGVFFAPEWGTTLDADSQLARVDLTTGDVTGRAVPGATGGVDGGVLDLSATPSGYLIARTGGAGPVDAALVQGRWTSDAAAIEAVTGPLVDSSVRDGRPTVARRRPDGADVWVRDDLTPWSGEGFQIGTTGNASIVNVCPSGDALECSDTVLLGLDVATGSTRWQRDDLGFAVAWGDGNALVGGSDGYEVIVAATGVAIDETRWPPGTFSQGCCGEGEILHSERIGGLVVAVDGAEVRIFYPAAVAGSPATVTPF